MGAEARREAIWTVAFAAVELWGPDSGPHDTVHVDLFETYLENLGERSDGGGTA
jgi:nitrile hydratase